MKNEIIENKTEQEQAIEAVIAKCQPDLVARKNYRQIALTTKGVKRAWKNFLACGVEDGDAYILALRANLRQASIARLVDAYKGEGYQCEYTSLEEAEKDILFRARYFGLVPVMCHVETAENAEGVVSVFYYVDFAYLFNED